jgi:hypothetical protein
MKERTEILKDLTGKYGLSESQADIVIREWNDFVTQIPVGTPVYFTGHEDDVRMTREGRIYDDPADRYVLVTECGLWPISNIIKAPTK